MKNTDVLQWLPGKAPRPFQMQGVEGANDRFHNTDFRTPDAPITIEKQHHDSLYCLRGLGA